MRTCDLLDGLQIEEVVNNLPQDIDGIYSSSSEVKQGGLFVCLKGSTADGHDFAAQAAEKGAVAVVCEKKLDLPVCQIVVKDARAALSLLAAKFFGEPAKSLKLISVVGTNGKTSTAFIISTVLNACGEKCALISTNGVYIGNEFFPNKLTTPDPMDMQRFLKHAKDAGCKFCVTEVSAHAIALKKTFGMTADMAVFTNFSQDHLDYFKTMENYRAVKKSYFFRPNIKTAAVNVDDALGAEIISDTDVPVITFGLNAPADVFAVDVSCEDERSSYVLNVCDDVAFVGYCLSGKFNVYNTLAAAAACTAFGIRPQQFAAALGQMKAIEGRNQWVSFPKGFKAVIDFAHTPEGIRNVLAHLRSSTFGRLITVFGCGGDRDKTKRAAMAEAVSEFSDYALLTSDNPRFEDPFDIMFEAEKGLSICHELVCDRGKAIAKAIGMAKKDDTIAILGKGHENYQEINGTRLHFSDMEVVLELLSANSRR